MKEAVIAIPRQLKFGVTKALCVLLGLTLLSFARRVSTAMPELPLLRRAMPEPIVLRVARLCHAVMKDSSVCPQARRRFAAKGHFVLRTQLWLPSVRLARMHLVNRTLLAWNVKQVITAHLDLIPPKTVPLVTFAHHQL